MKRKLFFFPFYFQAKLWEKVKQTKETWSRNLKADCSSANSSTDRVKSQFDALLNSAIYCTKVEQHQSQIVKPVSERKRQQAEWASSVMSGRCTWRKDNGSDILRNIFWTDRTQSSTSDQNSALKHSVYYMQLIWKLLWLKTNTNSLFLSSF